MKSYEKKINYLINTLSTIIIKKRELDSMAKKKEQSKGYLCKIKISAKKKREIEAYANMKGITFNRFVKDAINQSIEESKNQIPENNGVLRNQLNLFDVETYSITETQLNIDL